MQHARALLAVLLAAICLLGAAPASATKLTVGTGRALFGLSCPILVLKTNSLCAAVDLNFANQTYFGGSLSSFLTLTRASAETVVASNGLLTSAASGQLAISDLGLQVWESRTNQILHSNFAAVWVTTNATLTANAVAGPDGTVDAATITDNSTNGTHIVFYNNGTAVTGGQTQTASLYLQAGTLGFAELQLSDGSGNGVKVDINLSTCGMANGAAIGTGTTYIGSTGVASYNGWCRVTLTGTLNSSTTAYLVPFTANALGVISYAGTGQTINVWGAQLEQASFVSPYISTTTSAATRAADNIVLGGTLAAALALPNASVVATTNQSQASLAGTLVDANGVVLLGKTASNKCSTSVGVVLSSTNTATWTGSNKCGLAWTPQGGIISLNGTLTIDGTAKVPAGTFHLGSTSGTSAFWDGYISRLTAAITY